MNDAPERIWAEPGMPGYLDKPHILYTVEYIRKDHVDALLKAGRERALREALDIIGMYDENATCSECCDVTAINEAVTAIISKDKTDG